MQPHVGRQCEDGGWARAVDADGVRTREAGWGRVALLAGTIGGVALPAQTLLFLLDAADVLPGSPPFRETSAGRDEDLAAFFVASAERQHDIGWNIVLRDVLGPIAAVALIVLASAFVHVRGAGQARPQAWALVLGVGAVFKALADLVYLSQMGLWRDTGFTAEPPADIIAVGRTSEAITDLADHLEYAAFLTLAAGIAGLAASLSRWLKLLAHTVAVGLLISVVASLSRSGALYDIATLLTGTLLAPALLLGLGRSLAHPAPLVREPLGAGHGPADPELRGHAVDLCVGPTRTDRPHVGQKSSSACSGDLQRLARAGAQAGAFAYESRQCRRCPCTRASARSRVRRSGSRTQSWTT